MILTLEEFRIKFLDALRNNYRKNNPSFELVENYLRTYYGKEPLRLDHFASRSINGMGFGRSEVSRLAALLGYSYGGSLDIPERAIVSCWFEPPPGSGLEKWFFSEIQLEYFPRDIQQNVTRAFRKFGGIVEALLSFLNEPDGMWEKKLEHLVMFFNQIPIPWSPPEELFHLIAKDPSCQDIASVLAFGFAPNHFAILMKDPEYCRKDYTTMSELSRGIMKDLRIPMKEKVEGEGTALCQTATRAITRKTKVSLPNGRIGEIERPSSYIEFIERGIDPETGKRYEGFKPAQAVNIFKMTDRK